MVLTGLQIQKLLPKQIAKNVDPTHAWPLQ